MEIVMDGVLGCWLQAMRRTLAAFQSNSSGFAPDALAEQSRLAKAMRPAAADRPAETVIGESHGQG
jgi:hypothetical protein